MKGKVLLQWFPFSIYDWEEYMLWRGEDFFRKHLPGYMDMHNGLDFGMSIMMHQAFMAAMYEGIDIEVDPDCPIALVGNPLIKRKGVIDMSKNEVTTTPVRKVEFFAEGPVATTSSGSRYLLLGENLAWDKLWYLRGYEPDTRLIETIFLV